MAREGIYSPGRVVYGGYGILVRTACVMVGGDGWVRLGLLLCLVRGAPRSPVY